LLINKLNSFKNLNYLTAAQLILILNESHFIIRFTCYLIPKLDSFQLKWLIFAQTHAYMFNKKIWPIIDRFPTFTCHLKFLIPKMSIFRTSRFHSSTEFVYLTFAFVLVAWKINTKNIFRSHSIMTIIFRFTWIRWNFLRNPANKLYFILTLVTLAPTLRIYFEIMLTFIRFFHCSEMMLKSWEVWNGESNLK
jgi:hypothetical protein